jgi:hypothetical protein
VEGEWIYPSEAARLFGVSRQAIGHAIASRRLATADCNGRPKLCRTDVPLQVRLKGAAIILDHSEPTRADGYSSRAQGEADLPEEKELSEALNFLVENLKMHSEEYHYKTDSRKVKRCEEILGSAISELIARKERTSRFSHMELNGKLFSSKENCYQIESGLEC